MRHKYGVYRDDQRAFGPIEVVTGQLSVRIFVCSQLYEIIIYERFIEVMPAKERCYWTANKFYYLSRFNGKLELYQW